MLEYWSRLMTTRALRSDDTKKFMSLKFSIFKLERKADSMVWISILVYRCEEQQIETAVPQE
jgi:hypothetical protein